MYSKTTMNPTNIALLLNNIRAIYTGISSLSDNLKYWETEAILEVLHTRDITEFCVFTLGDINEEILNSISTLSQILLQAVDQDSTKKTPENFSTLEALTYVETDDHAVRRIPNQCIIQMSAIGIELPALVSELNKALFHTILEAKNTDDPEKYFKEQLKTSLPQEIDNLISRHLMQYHKKKIAHYDTVKNTSPISRGGHVIDVLSSSTHDTTCAEYKIAHDIMNSLAFTQKITIKKVHNPSVLSLNLETQNRTRSSAILPTIVQRRQHPVEYTKLSNTLTAIQVKLKNFDQAVQEELTQWEDSGTDWAQRIPPESEEEEETLTQWEDARSDWDWAPQHIPQTVEENKDTSLNHKNTTLLSSSSPSNHISLDLAVNSNASITTESAIEGGSLGLETTNKANDENLQKNPLEATLPNLHKSHDLNLL